MLSYWSRNGLFIILTIVLSGGAIFGQTSGFTYQGRLTDGGTPANGNYDLQFVLFDAAGCLKQRLRSKESPRNFSRLRLLCCNDPTRRWARGCG